MLSASRRKAWTNKDSSTTLWRAGNQGLFYSLGRNISASKQAFPFTKRKMQLWGHIRRLSMCKHSRMSDTISHLGSRVTQCLSKCSYSLWEVLISWLAWKSWRRMDFLKELEVHWFCTCTGEKHTTYNELPHQTTSCLQNSGDQETKHLKLARTD